MISDNSLVFVIMFFKEMSSSNRWSLSVQNVERSRTSKVSRLWQRLARRSDLPICNVEQFKTWFHVCTCALNWRNLRWPQVANQLWPRARMSRLSSWLCYIINHFCALYRWRPTFRVPTLHITLSTAHVLLPFLCTTTTMPRREPLTFDMNR